jgi:REP element-mobilizing transposase RayT
MARKPRLHVPGGVYHVMLDGNGGPEIFLTDEDRLHFYDLVEEGVDRFGHRIHGFCLMGNHVHLVVQVAETPLAKIVQNLSFRYTRWIHRRQRTVGHVFQGRYKAILVDADAYLLTLVRYVHLNPVRAALVAHPDDYRWSGHRTYLGLEATPLAFDGVGSGAVRQAACHGSPAIHDLRRRRPRRGTS